jgi:hypothetical protein
MDGTAARTVERFIRAKSAVMQRVLTDPETPTDIKKLDQRARAGLHLWASEEARGGGDRRRAWHYYADALAEFGPVGTVLGWLIRLRLRFALLRASQPPYSAKPKRARALAVGKTLLKERRCLAALARILRFLLRALSRAVCATPGIVPALLPLLFMLGVLYLLAVIASRP